MFLEEPRKVKVAPSDFFRQGKVDIVTCAGTLPNLSSLASLD